MSRYTILVFLFLGIGAVPFDTESRYSSCFLDRIKGTVYDFSSDYLRSVMFHSFICGFSVQVTRTFPLPKQLRKLFRLNNIHDRKTMISWTSLIKGFRDIVLKERSLEYTITVQWRHFSLPGPIWFL